MNFFIWEGSEEKARLLGKNRGNESKFRWVEDEETDYYFEMRIVVDKVPGCFPYCNRFCRRRIEIEKAKCFGKYGFEPKTRFGFE